MSQDNNNFGTQQAPVQEPVPQAAPVQEAAPVQAAAPVQPAAPAVPDVPEFDAADVEANKTIGGFSYVPILFWLGLVCAKDSKYGRFCANQGLILLIFGVGAAVLAVIPVLGWIVEIVWSVFSVIVMIMGMVSAFQGKAKRLPLIGKINIIK